ncbi:MAG: arsenate reductase family protein [Alkalibacterium sp.]|nr:arsenate reductase family protein [Alkalibacterium sp.]
MKFYCHPRCTTCKKAKKWLDEQAVDYDEISLLEDSPSKEKWMSLLKETDLTVKSFFNTSGNAYREQNLKETLPDMTIEEAAEHLSSNGMLVKRPFAVEGEVFTSGFKAEVYERVWGKGEY